MPDNALIGMTATEAVAALRKREVRPRELVEASIARIEEVDGAVNALPIRCFERALEQADQLEADGSEQQTPSLAGLPIAVKDYNDLGGVRTTYGSPIFSDNVPADSDATIARLERNGAIPVAKSNVPEWAGGHTFNPVHGLTRNPWNLGRSAGGSSGGSAAALASGQVWLATGNDLGGSLRTPAGFNGIVGLRPSPGLVPRGRRLQAFDTLWVEGPMARNVSDVALMLDAAAGQDNIDPLSFDPVAPFVSAVESASAPARVGFSSDLGIVPMAREIADVATGAVHRLGTEGVDVTTGIPDFSGALDAFQTLRAVLLGTMMGELLEIHRAEINPDIIGNIERGFSVTIEQLFDAERVRWQLAQKMAEFFEHHDLLICPSASIEPFPAEQTYVTEIDGVTCQTYIDWFAITFALTLTACPILSIPCGFTKAGLPVGLQLVGKPRGEAALLAAAKWIEEQFDVARSVPIDPRKDGTL
ncbi:amidase [Pseudaestuariivita atlantica]|uniref:Amidase n=2 Tax=Pseudaestuariivita atlantica TaxID=1317121 RepID=A0A0L1JRR6_9RHOB|nr:amidase [Pseudaestuariivita atlantica]